jgi:DNA-binding Lrp family transcriptional regulator
VRDDQKTGTAGDLDESGSVGCFGRRGLSEDTTLIAPTMSSVITAIVMVSVQTDRIPEVAQEIADLSGVSEVYSVAGDVDLIAVVRVREFDQIAEVIAGRISKVAGVLHTDTHIAFRAYSRHDLESAFAIGFQSAD